MSEIQLHQLLAEHLSGVTVTASDVLGEKYFYNAVGERTAGTIQSLAAQTFTPAAADQIIPAGKYLAGAQTIQGDANLIASNIRKNVRIFNVTGSLEEGMDVSDTTAAAGDVAAGKYFYTSAGTKTAGTLASAIQPIPTITNDLNNGIITAQYTPVAGIVTDTAVKTRTCSISTQGAQTITPSTADQYISGQQYLTGTQTIKGDANLIASNIRKNIRLFNITGTLETGTNISDTTAEAADVASGKYFYTAAGTRTAGTSTAVTTSDADATAGDILSGKTAYVNGQKLTGTYASTTQHTLLLMHFDNNLNASGLIGSWADALPLCYNTMSYGKSAWTPTYTTGKFASGGQALVFNTGEYGDEYKVLEIPVGMAMHNHGDFTIEMWVYPQNSSRFALFSGSLDYGLGIDTNEGKWCAWLSANGTSWDLWEGDTYSRQGTISVMEGYWQHVAYVRYGNTYTLYVGGEVSVSFNSTADCIRGRTFQLGLWGNNEYPFTGYIDELRISNIARYTSTFQPSASPFIAD